MVSPRAMAVEAAGSRVSFLSGIHRPSPPFLMLQVSPHSYLESLVWIQEGRILFLNSLPFPISIMS